MSTGSSLHQIKLTEKKREALKELEINSVDDLLTFYPFRYEERVLKDHSQWQQDENIIIQGRIISKPKYYRYRANQVVI
ncbi:MAG: hypothetical protein II126_04210, partial [Erysipelotrichaceae bacterium]|nr:hypothetical protein [Erysipelotrichaceae bacterium]